ncbi:hypothetical protein AC579_6381 [Pseudocercospora musae]|uniref:Uncharacterized protein n=1 Tax=Pseudocercospora musae TaxID=113226 RepID=A0A139IJ04_9PEZI|nr:hypothetical protein AC579_6381 [Pseudocercospora musae]
MPPAANAAASVKSSGSSIATKTSIVKPPVKQPCWCGDDCQPSCELGLKAQYTKKHKARKRDLRSSWV